MTFASAATTQVLAVATVFVALSLKSAKIAPRVFLISSSYLILWVGGLAGGILCMVAALFHFPLIDPWLAAFDARLGLSAAFLVKVVTGVPFAPRILFSIYFLSVLTLFLTAFALACLGRAERLWEFCAAYGFCLTVATLCSLPLPAAGAFEYLHLADLFDGQLPPGSGTYWLEALHRLRNSTSVEINPLGLHGLVAFPSFHTSMALMTAAAWRDDRYLRWPMSVWSGLVLVSTFPVGGHYVADVLAGAATWLIIFQYGNCWAAFTDALFGRLASNMILIRARLVLPIRSRTTSPPPSPISPGD